MNSSAFKANVHLNIFSFTSLSPCIFIFRGDKKKKNKLGDWASTAQSVAEVHFLKMQTFEQKVVFIYVCLLFILLYNGPSQ